MFSLEIGGLSFRAWSEARSLRDRVREVGLEPGGRPFREGLLLARPAADAQVGSGMWVLYESGSTVLRRSRDEDVVTQAACFHLLALAAAVASDLLPLRLRTILLPDGGALLVDPEAIHLVPGHERRLARRGVLVLPTTVTVVDVAAHEVRLPEQQVDPSVPTGSVPLRGMWLARRTEESLPGAAGILALARVVVRDPHRDLQRALDHADALTRTDDVIHHLPRPEIAAAVEALGSNQPG